jgi:hypothetical protein
MRRYAWVKDEAVRQQEGGVARSGRHIKRLGTVSMEARNEVPAWLGMQTSDVAVVTGGPEHPMDRARVRTGVHRALNIGVAFRTS